MSGAGKGDTYRKVDLKKFGDNWDRAFGNKGNLVIVFGGTSRADAILIIWIVLCVSFSLIISWTNAKWSFK